MQSVNSILSLRKKEKTISEEDKMLEEIKKSGKQSNVSMIAFTATPKPDTFELFGTTFSEGEIKAFDLYSMKQAIEEEYILDVLDNYVTWKTYCHINKVDNTDDPLLNSSTAKRKMIKYIDVQKTNILQKTEIIIEHFINNVASQLGGKAKAMVVTSSREAAVKYCQFFRNYLKENGYSNIGCLVAFSGKVVITEESGEKKEYTEEGMNNINEEKLRSEFDKSKYQFLIVADKYQTGFDQPKLCAMYVDKSLDGIAAVQTLSRLNRVCRPYNKKTFILDFKNDYAEIQKSFAPYYKDTIQFKSIDSEFVKELNSKIDESRILNDRDLEEFNNYIYKEERTHKDKENMFALLDNARRKYEDKDKSEQLTIKKTIKAFIKAYCFLIQTTCLESVLLHKKYNYLQYLIKEITPGSGGNDFDIADKIVISDFKQEKQEEHVGETVEGESDRKPEPPKTMTINERHKKRLSEIIKDLNAFYDKDFEVNSTSNDAMSIRESLLNKENIREKLKYSVKNNEYEKFKLTFSDCVVEVLEEEYEKNTEFYGFLLNNENVRADISNVFLNDIYEKLGGEGLHSNY